MDPHPLRRSSRRLSWLLRHGALESGLPMDEAGWAPVEAVLRELGITLEQLEQVVRDDNKSRLQLDGDRIRASQGHSLEGMPVTLQALEASWARWDEQAPIWHGTVPSALAGIGEEGIVAQRRSHVHLADALDSVVGKRSNAPIMLQVDPVRLRAAGQQLFVSPNGVILVRHVPLACIVDLHPMSRAACREQAHLRELLGLSATSPPRAR